MALTNPHKLGDYVTSDFTSPTVSASPPTVTYSGGYSAATGSYPHRKHHLVLADLVGLGAFTSGDITILTLPPNSIITRTLVKPATAITGVGTAVGYVKTTNHDYGTTTLDLKAAVSVTNTDLYVTEQKETFGSATVVNFHLIVDTTCDAITAGAVDIWVDYIIRSV